MAIGKSARFEIFARDGFCCQYCGSRPPDVVLELDHIHPVSKGGSDECINLITSCFNCNRGKRAKILGSIAPRPDADLQLLRVEQENCEVRRFLKAKKQRDKIVGEACAVLRETWARLLTDFVPSDRVLVAWINRYGADEIEKAIMIAAGPYASNLFGRDDESAFERLLPWIGAVLRNRDEERKAGLVQ